MGGVAVFLPCCLPWNQTMVEVMKIMGTSFKRSHACTANSVPQTLQQAAAHLHLHWRLLDTHRKVWLSLLWGHCSFLLNLVPTRFVLSSKNLFFWGGSVPCQISSLGNLSWALELLQQCKNSFGIIVLCFVGRLLGGSMVALNGGLLQWTYTIYHIS